MTRTSNIDPTETANTGVQGLSPMDQQLAAVGSSILANYQPVDVLSSYASFCAGTQAGFSKIMDAYVQSMAHAPQMEWVPESVPVPVSSGSGGGELLALGAVAGAAVGAVASSGSSAEESPVEDKKEGEEAKKPDQPDATLGLIGDIDLWMNGSEF